MTHPASRPAIAIAAILLSAVAALAQPPARTFDQLAVVAVPGERVDITNASGEHIRGTIRDIANASLTVVSGGVEHHLNMTDVSTITTRRGDPLDNGARWGFGIGAAFGVIGAAGAIALSGSSSAGERVAFGVAVGAVYGGIGAGIGVGIDAMVRGSHTIFANPLAARRVMLAPAFTSDRRALTVSLKF
jgi:hypothetical protein